VRPASLRRARWLAHPDGVRADAAMRDWLTTPGSLTARLIAHSRSSACRSCARRRTCAWRTKRRRSAWPAARVWEREVLLRCDGRPVVYGHTVVPMSATATDWPLFSALGERSLGSTLFYDPLVRRGQLEFARIRPGHPLLARVLAALGGDGRGLTESYYARRCVYRRRQGLLLVTEVFLPAVLNLAAANPI
jgi:chorismate--pyruvate lyase